MSTNKTFKPNGSVWFYKITVLNQNFTHKIMSNHMPMFHVQILESVHVQAEVVDPGSGQAVRLLPRVIILGMFVRRSICLF